MSYTHLRNKLAEVLETVHQIPEDDIAVLLPENEEDFKADEFKSKFLDLDKERIQTINQKGKDKFDQGYNKGRGESLTKFEKEIKEEFGIDDDVQGLDLVKRTIELSTKSHKGDPSKLTEDELKAHPTVIKILTEKDRSFKEQEKKIKEDFDAQLSSLNKKERFNKVSKKALSLLDQMNPVLSEDPVRASNQKNILLNQLSSYEFQEENDEFIPIGQDGKRLEDAHGNGINFDQLVKTESSKYFDFKKADDRTTPPAGGEGGSGSGARMPKNLEEYTKIQTDRSIPLEDRTKIKEAWQKANAAS